MAHGKPCVNILGVWNVIKRGGGVHNKWGVKQREKKGKKEGKREREERKREREERREKRRKRRKKEKEEGERKEEKEGVSRSEQTRTVKNPELRYRR